MITNSNYIVELQRDLSLDQLEKLKKAIPDLESQVDNGWLGIFQSMPRNIPTPNRESKSTFRAGRQFMYIKSAIQQIHYWLLKERVMTSMVDITKSSVQIRHSIDANQDQELDSNLGLIHLFDAHVKMVAAWNIVLKAETAETVQDMRSVVEGARQMQLAVNSALNSAVKWSGPGEDIGSYINFLVVLKQMEMEYDQLTSLLVRKIGVENRSIVGYFEEIKGDIKTAIDNVQKIYKERLKEAVSHEEQDEKDDTVELDKSEHDENQEDEYWDKGDESRED
jgi:hypothetical protein